MTIHFVKGGRCSRRLRLARNGDGPPMWELWERQGSSRVKDSAVEEFSQRLIAHGVPEQVIGKAFAAMTAAGQGPSMGRHLPNMHRMPRETPK
jgi:hypothetical protein